MLIAIVLTKVSELGSARLCAHSPKPPGDFRVSLLAAAGLRLLHQCHRVTEEPLKVPTTQPYMQMAKSLMQGPLSHFQLVGSSTTISPESLLHRQCMVGYLPLCQAGMSSGSRLPLGNHCSFIQQTLMSHTGCNCGPQSTGCHPAA